MNPIHQQQSVLAFLEGGGKETVHIINCECYFPFWIDEDSKVIRIPIKGATPGQIIGKDDVEGGFEYYGDVTRNWQPADKTDVENLDNVRFILTVKPGNREDKQGETENVIPYTNVDCTDAIIRTQHPTDDHTTPVLPSTGGDTSKFDQQSFLEPCPVGGWCKPGTHEQHPTDQEQEIADYWANTPKPVLAALGLLTYLRHETDYLPDDIYQRIDGVINQIECHNDWDAQISNANDLERIKKVVQRSWELLIGKADPSKYSGSHVGFIIEAADLMRTEILEKVTTQEQQTARIDMIKFRDLFNQYAGDTPVCVALSQVLACCINGQDLMGMPDLPAPQQQEKGGEWISPEALKIIHDNIDKICSMKRLPGETNDQYVYNRCFHLAHEMRAWLPSPPTL